MEIKKAAVIGGGTMGNGIAHIFAMCEVRVHLVETDEKRARNALKTIEKNLGRMVEKNKIDTAQKLKSLENISIYTSITEAVQDVELVVEAVPENFKIKKKVFTDVDNAAADQAILASNTSSISITKLAAITSRPDRFVGMHFFNPVPMMELVEIVKGFETSEETIKIAQKTVQKLNKTPVTVSDYPGFVSNRVLMPMINEAIFCVQEGVAVPEDVDTVMKLGMAHPMGPLRLADFIGLDVCLDILNVLHDGFKDPKYRPSPLLVNMVDAGRLGDKTGEGFYEYD